MSDSLEIKIKIGREYHAFTESDLFIDNGSCVQCTTKKYGHGARRSSAGWLRLSKNAIKTLDYECTRVQQEHAHGNSMQLFKFIPLGSKLSTHKHRSVTGLYRHSSKTVAHFTGVEFWCNYSNKWIKSTAVFRPDLIDLTDEELAGL